MFALPRLKLCNWRLVLSVLRGPTPYALGRRGESLAKQFLKKQQYGVLAANWQCGDGELDLIVYRGSTLVFVEVKSRRADTADQFGPWAAVNAEKQRRLRFLAMRFMRENRKAIKSLRLRQVRYDVIAVFFHKAARSFHIEHCQAAFA